MGGPALGFVNSEGEEPAIGGHIQVDTAINRWSHIDDRSVERHAARIKESTNTHLGFAILGMSATSGRHGAGGGGSYAYRQRRRQEGARQESSREEDGSASSRQKSHKKAGAGEEGGEETGSGKEGCEAGAGEEGGEETGSGKEGRSALALQQRLMERIDVERIPI